MRRGRLIAAPIAVLVAGCLAASAGATTTAPEVHTGESAPAKAWRLAMQSGDLAALTKMYDATSVVFPPDTTEQKGAAAIIKGYAGLFAKYEVAKVKVADAHWVQEGPLVVSWGLTTLTLHPKAGGADTVSQTRFTDAAVAVDGGWRYLVDHASVPTGK